MNVRRALRIARVGCVLLLPLIVSCGATVKSLDTDPSFTAKAFADGGLALLGCTTVVMPGSDDLDLSDRYSPPLRQVIKEKQRGVEVAEWKNTRQTLGDEKIQECLKAFHDTGMLEPATLQGLKGSLAGEARYVLVHRIESDQLKFHLEEEQSNVEGEMGSVTTGYLLGTERVIAIAFSIYDLEDGKRVCHATIEDAKGERHEVGVSASSTIGGIAGTTMDVNKDLDKIFNDDENPLSKFPSPPEQEEVVKRIYAKFAARLPAAMQ
ncbi:MAG: hypothetical protein JSW58_05560 [Candidatus Latescibacterota bacterium]|nr:MAG: hypothetical protein JSW58_05560 [Candidatus Latescibacterota bacterium]